MTVIRLREILVATHNEGKRKEFEKLLAPFAGTIFSAAQKNLPEPEETEDNFAGNAKLKALAGARAAGMLTLADDSGFGVTALGGKPGVYSARFAKNDYDGAAQRLIAELGSAKRDAFFTCVLALARPDGAVKILEGRCDGTMIYPGRGTQGFGYDPYFVPIGHQQTFAEMDAAQKHALSHRGQAMKKLGEFLAGADGQSFIAHE